MPARASRGSAKPATSNPLAAQGRFHHAQDVGVVVDQSDALAQGHGSKRCTRTPLLSTFGASSAPRLESRHMATAAAPGVLRSSIGKKVVMAASGAILFGFVVGHMLGNLQVYLGPAQLNAYAAKLQHLGPLLWGCARSSWPR
jgi:hypothetical protein